MARAARGGPAFVKLREDYYRGTALHSRFAQGDYRPPGQKAAAGMGAASPTEFKVLRWGQTDHGTLGGGPPAKQSTRKIRGLGRG